MDMFNNGSAIYHVYTNYAIRLMPGELMENIINPEAIHLQNYIQKYAVSYLLLRLVIYIVGHLEIVI